MKNSTWVGINALIYGILYIIDKIVNSHDSNILYYSMIALLCTMWIAKAIEEK